MEVGRKWISAASESSTTPVLTSYGQPAIEITLIN